MTPMANDNISWDILNMNLKQLGATNIETTPTKINRVEFKICPILTVSYFFNAKNEDKIFLQRIDPYPIQNMKFEDVDEILVDKFENSIFKLLDMISKKVPIKIL